MSLDPAKRPKAIDIDLEPSGGFVGIDEFRPDGTPRLALAARSARGPSGFTTKPDSTHLVLELMRFGPAQP